MPRLTTTVHPTPVGDSVIVLADDQLVALQLVQDDVEPTRERLALRLSSVPADDARPASAVTEQLDEYFAGQRRQFEIPLDWRLVHGFTRTALEAVRRIPYGETASYGEVAVLAGSPRAARAVGTACATTPFSVVVPVHRVVRADGTVGEYGRHPEVKRFLLSHESGCGA